VEKKKTEKPILARNRTQRAGENPSSSAQPQKAFNLKRTWSQEKRKKSQCSVSGSSLKPAVPRGFDSPLSM